LRRGVLVEVAALGADPADIRPIDRVNADLVTLVVSYCRPGWYRGRVFIPILRFDNGSKVSLFFDGKRVLQNLERLTFARRDHDELAVYPTAVFAYLLTRNQ
jgi:hypothetical protein